MIGSKHGIAHPFLSEFPEINVISNVKEGGVPIGGLGDGEAIWHCDMTYVENPPRAAALHAWEVPPSGGDAVWSNPYLAYETLPGDLKQTIKGRVPNLPTLDEAGVASFEYAPWYGVFAPAGTPPTVVQKVHEAIKRVVSDPEIRDKLGKQGLEVQPMTREEFVQIVNADLGRWARVIKALGIKGE